MIPNSCFLSAAAGGSCYSKHSLRLIGLHFEQQSMSIEFKPSEFNLVGQSSPSYQPCNQLTFDGTDSTSISCLKSSNGSSHFIGQWKPWSQSIPVEMGDPFTKMCQNFFSFLSHTQQRGYVIATTQALSFSFFPSLLHYSRLFFGRFYGGLLRLLPPKG